MHLPNVSARIVETDKLARVRVKCRQVRPLVTVADDAAQRKIVVSVASTMLPGDDVVKLMWVQRFALRQTAVFASPLRPRSDTSPRARGRHAAERSSALSPDLRMMMRYSSLMSSSSSRCSASPNAPAWLSVSSLFIRTCARLETW